MAIRQMEARASLFSSSEMGKRGVQNNTQGQQQKKEWMRITNDKPEEFEATTATKYMSGIDIAKKINHVMSTVFDDWHGCLVTNNNGMVQCTFYFKPTNAPVEKGSHRAFIPVGGVAKGDSLMDKFTAVNNLSNKSSNFMMTEYASELLYDLMGGAVKPRINPFNPKSYNSVVSEQSASQLVGSTVYCLVSCIDVNRLLALIYGERNKDGSRQYYEIAPIRPLDNSQQPSIYSNWLHVITAMSEKEFKKTVQAVGAVANFGDVPAITGSY